MTILLLLQPDMGSFFVMAVITFAIMFVAGVGLLKYIVVAVIMGIICVLLIKFSPYRARRVTSFLDPWSDEFGSGYQLTQSLMAYGRGGLTGEGLGNSYQNRNFR